MTAGTNNGKNKNKSKGNDKGQCGDPSTPSVAKNATDFAQDDDSFLFGC